MHIYEYAVLTHIILYDMSIYICVRLQTTGLVCIHYSYDTPLPVAPTANTDEIEPLDPSTTSPDMACLRLINESELRKGAIIGSGAFGTVFKVSDLSLSSNVSGNLFLASSNLTFILLYHN